MSITSLTSLEDTISQQTFGSFDSFPECNIYLTKGIQDIFQKIIRIMEMNEEMFSLVQLAFFIDSIAYMTANSLGRFRVIQF